VVDRVQERSRHAILLRIVPKIIERRVNTLELHTQQILHDPAG